jgi:hypothetical protein
MAKLDNPELEYLESFKGPLGWVDEDVAQWHEKVCEAKAAHELWQESCSAYTQELRQVWDVWLQLQTKVHLLEVTRALWALQGLEKLFELCGATETRGV